MARAVPTSKLFARGFPTALDELRAIRKPAEPDIAFGLYALLRSAGMNVTYCEADVLSGHAAQFLYHRAEPECADLSFVPPVETLLRALDVTWKEVTPSGPLKAYEVLHEWIVDGRLSLVRLKQPLLVYGYADSATDPVLLTVPIWARQHSRAISLSECDQNLWRYPIDEGNVLICITAAPAAMRVDLNMVRGAARRAVRVWHEAELAGCASGEEAYGQFAADLRDKAVDFTDERSALWMGRALWRQWTTRVSLHEFFERMAPRFGGPERTCVTHAAFCYAQCVEAWKAWAEFLGPTWPHERDGFPDEYPDDFVLRWRHLSLRSQAAQCVDEARSWEEKAITELTKIIR
jgi:hypothetical protein